MKHIATIRPAAAATILLLAATGCRSTNHLAEYDFGGARVAAVAPLAAPADVYTDLLWRSGSGEPTRNPLEAAVRVGSTIMKEAGAAEARHKLQNAEERVDVAGRIADGAVSRVSRMLRAEPVSSLDAADYALEILVEKQGIFAVDSFTGSMQYGLDGRIRLVHLDSGRKVWERKIRERERFASSTGGNVGAVLSGVVLADMSEDDMAEALERLSDRMAVSVARRLGDDLNR